MDKINKEALQKVINNLFKEYTEALKELLDNKEFQKCYDILAEIKILIKISQKLVTYKWEL